MLCVYIIIYYHLELGPYKTNPISYNFELVSLVNQIRKNTTTMSGMSMSMLHRTQHGTYNVPWGLFKLE